MATQLLLAQQGFGYCTFLLAFIVHSRVLFVHRHDDAKLCKLLLLFNLCFITLPCSVTLYKLPRCIYTRNSLKCIVILVAGSQFRKRQAKMEPQKLILLLWVI